MVLPNTIKSVGIRAFRDCEGFEGSLTLSENLEIIEDLAFAGGGDIMVNYTGELIIPNKVKHIGLAAFQNCSSLTSLTFEDNSQLTEIGESAFRKCSSLTSVTFGDNSQLTSIGEGAFYECWYLPSIEIPNSVTYIGDYAFYDCSSLISIICYAENVPGLGYDAFYYTNGITICVPENFVELYEATYPWNEYDIVAIGGIGYPSIVYHDGYSLGFRITNLSPAECEVLDCTGKPTDLTIPSSVEIEGTEFSVTYIGYNAFYGCSSLTSIEIPNSVTEIGVSAFNGCSSLTSIEIPNSVTEIGYNAFYGCSSLTSVICHAENVPETNDNNFDACPFGMTIYVPENSVLLYRTESPWNNYNIVAIPEIPAVPAATATATSSTTILLIWNAVKYATSYNVYSADTLVANVTATAYIVTGLKAETEYTFEVSAVNITGKSERASVTAITLGESLEEMTSSINIYPNPVNDKLYIETEVEVLEVSVYDVYGRQQSTVNGQQSLSIDVNELNSGVYFVKVVTSEGEIVKRFIKK